MHRGHKKGRDLGSYSSAFLGYISRPLDKPDLMHLGMEVRLGLRRVLTKREKTGGSRRDLRRCLRRV